MPMALVTGDGRDPSFGASGAAGDADGRVVAEEGPAKLFRAHVQQCLDDGRVYHHYMGRCLTGSFACVIQKEEVLQSRCGWSWSC